MLKITDNIFEVLDGRLEFVTGDDAPAPSPSDCGVIIPDVEELEFSNESSSLPHAAKWIEQAGATCWFLFVIDSAWQIDSPRMRHVGLKPSLNNEADWTTQLAATAILSEQGGGIRHCGLVRLKSELFDKALGFIAKHQRTAFLVGHFIDGSDPSKLLHVLHQEGAQNVLRSKKSPFFDWVRLLATSGLSDLVFITSFGWLEEHCDFRFLALSRRATLEALRSPDSPPSTPRG